MDEEFELAEDAHPHRVFGRRKGKQLRLHQKELMETLLPRVDALTFVGSYRASDTGAHKQLWLEIGFGGGEHLAAQAAAHPDIGFIGCEPFVNGVAKLLVQVEARGLDNVYIHADDATRLLARLPDASVDRVYILFPDPWPKRRQRKRRFFNEDTLCEFARVMKPGAELRFATDIDDYAGWALARVLASGEIVWEPGETGAWNAPWPDHHTTKYESKAVKEGRKSVYLTFRRVATV